MPSDERGCVHGQQKVCADCVSDQRRGEGESVATYWARILHECEVTGEPIEIANKFGDVVAVMVSWKRYLEDQWWMLCHAHLDMLIDQPAWYLPSMGWDEVMARMGDDA